MGYFFWISLVLFLLIIVVSVVQRWKRTSDKEKSAEQDQVINLTDETFDEVVATGIVLVDFWAPWCAPCRKQNPIISQISTELGPEAKICKINVDDYRKAALRMKIKNIPNIIIFKNGTAVRQLIGAKPKHTIVHALKTVIDQ